DPGHPAVHSARRLAVLRGRDDRPRRAPGGRAPVHLIRLRHPLPHPPALRVSHTPRPTAPTRAVPPARPALPRGAVPTRAPSRAIAGARLWRCRPLERRGDVAHWQVWLGVAAGGLPSGQCDVAGAERLVGDLAEQVADDVEPAALL